tara:strand:+ start:19057 stop:20817 length:1761 start_codon:yes stop_codon:yes gene_type:complete
MQETKLLNTILQAYQFREQNQHVSAMTLAKQCLNQLPQNPEVHCLWSLLLADEENYPEATKAINIAIKINPSKAEYYFFLAEIKEVQKKYYLAEMAYKECVKRNKKHYLAHAKLGQTLELQNKLKPAIKHYLHAVKINPKYASALFHLGLLHMKINDRITALVYFHKALELEPKDISTLLNLGKILFAEKQYELALKFLHKVIKFEPQNNEALDNIILIYLELNNHEKALPYIRELQNTLDNNLQSWWYLSLCKTFVYQDDPDIEYMQLLLKRHTKSDNRSYLYFALGKAYHDCHNYKVAFEYYENGNNIIHKKRSFNISAYKTNISKIITNHKTSKIKRMHLSDDNSFQPLFIIGLPGSGKRLLETALVKHYKIEIAWDIGISQIVNSDQFDHKLSGHYPHWLKTMSKEEALALKEVYFERLNRDVDGRPKFIIDTLPDNFLYIGLIKWLFPNAKIIHCTRDPLDICLSMYFKYCSQNYAFSYDQDMLAEYYLQYERMMSFWGEQFEQPYVSIQYEDFVASPKEILNIVYQYLGLRQPKLGEDYDLSYLHHHDINKWQNYKFFLKPLLKKLATNYVEAKEHIKRG